MSIKLGRDSGENVLVVAKIMQDKHCQSGQQPLYCKYKTHRNKQKRQNDFIILPFYECALREIEKHWL